MQLSPADMVLWNRVNPAIAYMRSAGVSVGAVAFIDKEGRAITHQMTISRAPSEIQTATGQILKFKVIHKDTPSQLVLIQTERKPNNISIVEPASYGDGSKGFVFAVLAHGPCKAEITNSGTIGIDEATRRSVPMAVVRIEQSASAIGGGLLINDRMKLVGAFAATLATSSSIARIGAPGSSGEKDGQRGGKSDTSQQTNLLPNNPIAQLNGYQNLGPQGMIVGYSPTWEVVTKAFHGFQTPSHKAEQGLLGLYVVDTSNGSGLLVKEFFPNSPAQAVGIEIGDIIEKIAGETVRTQMDFARATYRLVPGANVVIVLRRGKMTKSFLVTVGSQLLANSGRLELSIEGSSRRETR